jgi:hypothetical protein
MLWRTARLAAVLAVPPAAFWLLPPLEAIIAAVMTILLFGQDLPDCGRWLGRRFARIRRDPRPGR